MSAHQTIAILVGLSIIPPLLYMAWVRSLESSRREPMGQVLLAFLYGAIIGAGLALLLNGLFNAGTVYYAEAATGLSAVFLTVVVAAPFIEELTKGLGLGRRRSHIDELEDGIIYGTAIGLGFATTENLLYGITALYAEGVDVAIATIVYRTVSAMLLHAGTTALLGFGYARLVLRDDSVAVLLPYYLVAVLIHAAYNFMVLTSGLLGFVAAVVLVLILSSVMRSTIRKLDALPHSQYA